MSSVEFEMGLCVWVILGSLYVDAQGYVPALLENLCGMSCSGTYWLFSIHSEGLPERFTELHEEEEWEEGDRDKQEVQKGDSRGERQIYAVLCSLSVLCSPEHHRDSQNWIEKRRGREEIEVIWGRKRRVKRGRE